MYLSKISSAVIQKINNIMDGVTDGLEEKTFGKTTIIKTIQNTQISSIRKLCCLFYQECRGECSVMALGGYKVLVITLTLTAGIRKNNLKFEYFANPLNIFCSQTLGIEFRVKSITGNIEISDTLVRMELCKHGYFME